MRISDWSSDVCSSDLDPFVGAAVTGGMIAATPKGRNRADCLSTPGNARAGTAPAAAIIPSVHHAPAAIGHQAGRAVARLRPAVHGHRPLILEIGRTSGRERVGQEV